MYLKLLVVSSLVAAPALAHADAGAVFTSDNAAAGNHVVAFHRTEAGALVPAGSIATGGLGSGAALGSQGAVTLADGGRVLLVVNAGSNDVSSFEVDGPRLRLRSRVASGGTHPISVGAHGHLVYVLNDGGAANVSGFRLDRDGHLDPIAGSTRALGSDAPAPAEVAIAPDGDTVVVTEKGTSRIDVFRVRGDGTLGEIDQEVSAGTTPFGFGFTPTGLLVVSEAATGSVSSYEVIDDRTLEAISPAIVDGQAAPCWIAIGGDGRYAFTTNAGSNSISTYRVHHDGSIELVHAPTPTATHPTDEAVDRDSRRLFVVANGSVLQGFSIGHDGMLYSIGSASVPAGSTGVAAN